MTLDDLIYQPGLMAGQRILVSGGGTGLGRVMAEALLILGAEIYICGRRANVLEATANELMAAHGGRVVPLVCDIRDEAAIAAMVQQIWDDGGALTGLLNNAAGNFVSRTEDLSPRAFDAIASIVFRGSFVLTLECGKRWLAAGQKASVLSILTTWVWNGSPYTVPSAMAKNVLTISHGSRSGLFGMGCKARCAVDSSAIDKRRNAADRPKRPLPEGLERNRAIGRPSCLHGHEPMRRIRATHSSRLRANAAHARSSIRSPVFMP